MQSPFDDKNCTRLGGGARDVPPSPASARSLDQFYTAPEVAERCHAQLLSVLRAAGLDAETALWLEPSAGAGAFLCRMPAARSFGLDLDPKCPGTHPGDFLQFDPRQAWPTWSPGSTVITEGNPPFGKNASLAVRFFNKAAEFSTVIAFIVPLTFRKQSVQKRLSPLFELVRDQELAALSFVFEGVPYDVSCCFQVWVRNRTNTAARRDVQQAPLTHPDFEYVDRSMASIAFRRVGGNAGRFFEQFEQYATPSHYFIRPTIDAALFKRVLAAIDWTGIKKNTAGNPSISKTELVREYAAHKRRLTDPAAQLEG